MLGTVSTRFRPSPEEERRQRAIALASRLRPPPTPPPSALVAFGEALAAGLVRARSDLARMERLCSEAEGLIAGRLPGQPAETAGKLTDLVARVAAAHGVTLAEIRGRARAVRLMIPRFEIYWIGWYGLGLSTPRIGAACGGRDHSTVLYGRDRMDSILLDTFGLAGRAALALSEEMRREALRAAFASTSQRYSQAHTERARRMAATKSARDPEIAARVMALGSLKAAARDMRLGNHVVRRAMRRHAQATGANYADMLAQLRHIRRSRRPPGPSPEVVLAAYRRIGSKRATGRDLGVSEATVRRILAEAGAA
jgi:hypothetical protein